MQCRRQANQKRNHHKAETGPRFLQNPFLPQSIMHSSETPNSSDSHSMLYCTKVQYQKDHHKSPIQDPIGYMHNPYAIPETTFPSPIQTPIALPSMAFRRGMKQRRFVRQGLSFGLRRLLDNNEWGSRESKNSNQKKKKRKKINEERVGGTCGTRELGLFGGSSDCEYR